MAETTKTTKSFRSGLEKRVAGQLTLASHPFKFEPHRISYTVPARPAKYLPDFVIIKKDGSPMYIETKGRFTSKDRTKHLWIRQSNPHLDIRFVFQRAKNKLYKGSKTTYGDWAEKQGFLWADNGVIPLAWLSE